MANDLEWAVIEAARMVNHSRYTSRMAHSQFLSDLARALYDLDASISRALRQPDVVIALEGKRSVLPMGLRGLPTLTDDMRHAANEDDANGNHLQACYLRTGADELDRCREALLVAVSHLQLTDVTDKVYGPLMHIIGGTEIPEDWALIAKAASKRD